MIRARLAAAAALLVALAVAAQTYPTPLRQDHRALTASAARPTSTRASSAPSCQGSLGQPFVVENRPGGGAVVGTDAVAKSRARRLHAAHDVEHAHRQRDADPEEALRPDARPRADHRRQLLRPADGGASVGAGEQPEGIHRARQGEAGQAQLRLLRPGTPYHLAGELFKSMAGVDIVHVPAQGQRPGARAAFSAARCR